MKAGIILDNWKQSIFERRLKEAGYSWTISQGFTEDGMVITIETPNVIALGEVIKACEEECEMTGEPR